MGEDTDPKDDPRQNPSWGTWRNTQDGCVVWSLSCEPKVSGFPFSQLSLSQSFSDTQATIPRKLRSAVKPCLPPSVSWPCQRPRRTLSQTACSGSVPPAQLPFHSLQLLSVSLLPSSVLPCPVPNTNTLPKKDERWKLKYSPWGLKRRWRFFNTSATGL